MGRIRATGVTAYLKNGATPEKAAAMANHASLGRPNSMIGGRMSRTLMMEIVEAEAELQALGRHAAETLEAVSEK